MLTVKQLIEQLSQQDQNAKVIVGIRITDRDRKNGTDMISRKAEGVFSGRKAIGLQEGELPALKETVHINAV